MVSDPFLKEGESGEAKVAPAAETVAGVSPHPGFLYCCVGNFPERACIECGQWAASGGLRCEDCQEDSLYD